MLSGVSAANVTDTAAPKVNSTDPAKNAVQVPGDKVIKVVFNEPVKAGTNWIELKNSAGTEIPITKSIGTKVLTIKPNKLLVHGTKYTLSIHTNSLTDMAGNPVSLYTTSFTVDSIAPKVSSTDPTKNAAQVPGDKTIKVVFNEPVKAGTNWIELENSAGTEIPITKSIGTKVLTIKPNKLLVHGTKYTLSIHTNSLTDMAGNPVALYTTSFTVDSVAPKVSSTDPTKNAAQVPGDKTIKVVFNEPVKAGTNWIELENSNGTATPVSKSIGTKVLTIKPNKLLVHGTKYTLSIHTNSLTDMAGNPVSLYTTSFTVDSIAPKVSSTDPTKNAAQVPGDKVIKVVFNEPVKAGTNWIELENSNGTATPVSKSIGTKVLTIKPNKLLVHGTKYTLSIHTNSLTDMAGNPVSLYTTSFTVDSIAPKVSSTDPANNAVNVPSNKVIKVTFNEPVKAGSLWIDLYTGPYSTGTFYDVTTSISGKVLTVTPTAFLKGKYILSLHTGSILDLSGNSLAATSISFCTQNAIYNNQSRKSFNSIQDAINDNLTLKGHVIEVSSGTYTENVVINKNLTIFSNGNVKVQASNSSKPVFTINRSGSGSLIQGFVISGALNSYGILLDGCSNFTINNNTITNNYFGILTNTIKTENNAIINNNITLNQELGIGTWNSDNCVIYGNTITYNGYGGITLFDSNNCIIHTNLIMENFSPDNDYSSGILISGSNNATISNNLIPKNIFGIYIDYCENYKVYGNLIAQGMVGIYTDYSSGDINFNRIAANLDYELINEYGDVDATNNWWGSNSNPLNLGEIISENGYTDYNPWLVLSIDPASTVNSGGNASITADLTHNNLGEDTSSLGHVIKGIPITFSTSYGKISSQALTFNGQAAAILNLGTTASKTVTINAYLDNQTISKQMVIAHGVAKLNITSSARDSSNNPIKFTYTVPLNNSVTWISVLWKNTSIFHGQLQVIVNGTVVNTKAYINPAYNNWKNSYRSAVFSAIIYANNYILQDGMNPNTIPASFWNDLTSMYGLTSTELQFIKNHRLEFVDNLTVKLTYPGVDAPTLTVTDPETNNTINLNFTGNTILRTSTIMYMDGLFSADYEGVKSFAIATTKVTDSIAQYWANQKNATDTNGNLLYPAGGMKAAYGTFFTALMMIYCHDILANTAASEFNVTWSRTHPVAVSVGDDAYQTYLTLECDHSMGMTVVGSLKNKILFNSACSSQIPTIEYGIMQNLDFIYQYGTVSMDVMGSVARDMFYALWAGTDLELFTQNDYIIMKLVGRDDLVLLYDPETGIMRDINTANGYSGAYCFHDGITDLVYDFMDDVKDSASDFREWASERIGNFINCVIPDVDVVIHEDRIVPCAIVGIGLTLYTLGLFTGVSEILTVGGISASSVIQIVGGAFLLGYDAGTGELTSAFTDPWITIYVEGYQVVPPW